MIIEYVALAGASATMILCASQAFRYMRAAEKLERTSKYARFVPEPPRQYVMCGGCGASVECQDDGFTPKYHSCFTPPADIMESAAAEAGYIDLPSHVEKARKIPIGLSGHLHTTK